jgi:hypothetical protein
MSAIQRADQLSRDAIMKALSDEEVARVSTAETATNLISGEEYVDLENLERGVQRADKTTKLVMGHVVPRNSVRIETWARITALLTSESK